VSVNDSNGLNRLSEAASDVNADAMNEESRDSVFEVPGVVWISDPALREMWFPELLWLIPNELPIGYTLIIGAPKVGKTALILPLAQRLAGEGKRVLYIKLDDSLRRMKTRTIMAAPRAVLPTLWYLDGWQPRTRDEAFYQLGAWIAQLLMDGQGLDAVFIDTYGRFIGERTGRDVFSADYSAGAMFKHICEQHNTSLIVTHHARKAGGDSEDWLDMVSGSAGMAASADSIWYITRTRGGRDGTLHITGNDMEESEKPVVLGPDMVWRWNNTITAAQARHSGVPRAVLDFLMKEPEASASRIVAFLGAPANTVHVALQRLGSEGLLEWKRAGKDCIWSLTVCADNRVQSDPAGPPSFASGEAAPAGSRASVPPETAPAPGRHAAADPAEVVPVRAGSGQTTSKLVEFLSSDDKRLYPLFKLDDEIKKAIPWDRMCLGGKGNQFGLFPSGPPDDGLVFRFDRKAAYWSSEPWVVPNVLTRSGPKTWDEIKGERLAGVFEIIPTPWVHKNMPSPYGLNKPRSRELVTRSTLNRLRMLSTMVPGKTLGLMEFPKILSGYTGRGTENLFTEWQNWCLLQRREAAHDEELLAYVKDDQNLAIGSMRIVGQNEDGSPKSPGVIDRWDWQYGFISHHYAMLNHYAIRSQIAGEPLIAMGNTDELVYWMPHGTPRDWVPQTLKPMMERRQFALKAVESAHVWFEAGGRGNR
jgi:AAA domain-containing protein